MCCKFHMFNLPGLVTVDETTDDDFLDTTRSRYAVTAPTHLFSHGTRAAAVSRCMTSTDQANIVGHGEPGIIATGSGRCFDCDPAQLISTEHIGDWQQSQMTRLTLLGCNTGEGRSGAKLLFAIAQATGACVSAPTGYVYIGLGCDDLYLEPGTGWQTATPDEEPEPIFDPQPVLFLPQHVRLMVDVTFVDVQISRVGSVILYAPGLGDTPGPELRRWERNVETVQLLSRIDFARPRRRGPPAAIQTGMLQVNANADDFDGTRMFRIYNDNALQDMQYPELLYRANIAPLRG
jgi:hypothetical protein